ncbi:Major facilitator superfamily protein [Perilla frutescens var. hirtella]|uniref:Major facilitator superfamily protein n=1 Tax=Perilla frutescens var. hirtella TaxID=608512 RepID=A0AAD4JJ90_PERFH|nr:Major facilitator superfamily protein [Perilla frutescens var. hirtella]
MAITGAGEGITAAETPTPNDVVPGSVDFKGRPSVRSKSGCWKSASFIAGFETAERFCYYGISSNLVSYLTGELGQSTAAAAANLNAWYGTAALSPILGAVLADSFLGRFRTIIFSSLLYILGLGFLTLSATINSLSCKNAANNTVSCNPSQLQTAFFFFSLYLIAFAQGGHKPCLQAFGADQFDVGDEKECAAKSSFFNWWFWFSCLGVVLALSLVTYIQENLSWEIGFGIPSLVMCFSLLIFSIGSITYRFSIDKNGSHPFVRMIHVFLKLGKNKQPPSTPSSLESLNKGLLTLDDEKSGAKEAKTMVKLIPIWCTSLAYTVVYAQPSTLFTKQAATMDRHIGGAFEIPAASLQLCISLSIMIFVSIYDCLFVPVARSITKRPSGITTLQRIGIGLILSLLSIVVAAVVEAKRLEIARGQGLVDLPTAVIPMSVWWLAPQYTLSGISDVFGMVGLQEFFYDQVPCELKSTGLALYLSILGVGSLASSFLVSVIQNATSGDGRGGWFSDNLNRAHLDYFYWLLAGLSAVSLAAYVYFARNYVYSGRVVV